MTDSRDEGRGATPRLSGRWALVVLAVVTLLAFVLVVLGYDAYRASAPAIETVEPAAAQEGEPAR
jgi:hypothetical protein